LLSIKIENLALDKIRPEPTVHSYPLLFIHGAGGTSRCWHNYLQYFSQAGWECLAINLRGHHPSERDESLSQVTIEDYIADVEKVIQSLNIPHCVVIGHSLGGLIALKIAGKNHKIKGVVSIAGAPPLGVPIEINTDLPYGGNMMKTMFGFMNMKPIKPTFFTAEQTILNNIDPTERKKIFSMFVAESLVVGYQVAQGFPVNPLKVKCPKLIIGCRKDVMAPEIMQLNIAEFFHGDYLGYKQFAHLPMLEKKWEKSAADISKWLIGHIAE
jgi:pimeloyl-ACP methyl ester carboxylesterase